MQRSKNTTTLALMISSIVLIILLEGFWLKSSYENAFADFHRDASILFRTTVLGLRDSMFMKNVEVITGDPADDLFIPGHGLSGDTARLSIRTKGAVRDSMKRGESGFQVYVASSERIAADENILKPLSGKLQAMRLRGRARDQKFVVRLNQTDTLDADTLRLLFRKALSEANIDVPFQIRRIETGPPQHPGPFPFGPDVNHNTDARTVNAFSDALTTDDVRVSPVHLYNASLINVRAIVLREIAPEMLFVFFLTLVITSAFIVMLRNIRSQQRLVEAKNEFISNVTHELKTPVATVSVALEAMKNFRALENPGLTKEYLDIAQRELNRLAILTDKILTASVIEGKGLAFEKQMLDLDITIRQVLSSMQMIIEKRGATVIYKSEGESFQLYGGSLHLTNMICNLVDNALKYSGDHPQVTILLKDARTMLVLTVCDQGIGIAPEYHDKVFEKFFRVPSGDIHDTKGYGLGLSYVASVVKGHAGTIQLNSSPGNGSEFTITLPRPAGRIINSPVTPGSLTAKNIPDHA
ncbi:MAG TPA: HAMP domain-containing sensor histidine kinase [Ohtaekwangia sp.]|nr:HAMP domain-containing sensor histidine kinase [Ohtaekwangia sp.]